LLADDVLKKYREAGRIAGQARDTAKKLVKPGASVLDVCDEAERMIIDMGGELAFPCNICMNDVAAHYSPPPDATTRIPEGAIVKVDVGVHVDGYIADTATSVGLGVGQEEMIITAEECLERAIESVKPDIKSSEIGRAIEEVVKRHGYKPIWNLTGHQISRYVLHTGKAIPNVSKLNGSRVKEDEVYAIEPFVTLPRAAGEVQGADEIYIYRFHKDRSIKDGNAKKLVKAIKSRFRSLPFSTRWLVDELPRKEFRLAFKRLLDAKTVTGYPVLMEKSGSIVAQAEHTVIVTGDGCEVTTR
jgi:methionyl aminopeptidase